MKVNIDKITARLDELATVKRQKVEKWQIEYKNAVRKADTIEDDLKATEDIDEYKKLIAEKKENADFLDYLNTNKKNLNTPAISETESRSIQKELQTGIEDLQGEYIPKIEKEIEKVVALLDEYYQEADKLETLRDDCAKLLNGRPCSTYLASGIADKTKDPLCYSRHFITAYNQHRANVGRIARGVVNNLNNPWYNPEEAEIAKELRRRIKNGK